MRGINKLKYVKKCHPSSSSLKWVLLSYRVISRDYL